MSCSVSCIHRLVCISLMLSMKFLMLERETIVIAATAAANITAATAVTAIGAAVTAAALGSNQQQLQYLFCQRLLFQSGLLRMIRFLRAHTVAVHSWGTPVRSSLIAADIPERS